MHGINFDRDILQTPLTQAGLEELTLMQSVPEEYVKWWLSRLPEALREEYTTRYNLEV